MVPVTNFEKVMHFMNTFGQEVKKHLLGRNLKLNIFE